jgi:hypothetical protein
MREAGHVWRSRHSPTMWRVYFHGNERTSNKISTLD